MPVGTKATVKTLDSADLDDIGFPIVLANTITYIYDRVLNEFTMVIKEFMAYDGYFLLIAVDSKFTLLRIYVK